MVQHTGCQFNLCSHYPKNQTKFDYGSKFNMNFIISCRNYKNISTHCNISKKVLPHKGCNNSTNRAYQISFFQAHDLKSEISKFSCLSCRFSESFFLHVLSYSKAGCLFFFAVVIHICEEFIIVNSSCHNNQSRTLVGEG